MCGESNSGSERPKAGEGKKAADFSIHLARTHVIELEFYTRRLLEGQGWVGQSARAREGA